MDFPPVRFRPVSSVRATSTARAAIWLAMLVGVPVTTVHAQTIDEPGVHLVDAAHARDRVAKGEAATALAHARSAERCTQAGNRDTDSKICMSPIDESEREDNLDAAKRSGIEVGTHVRDRHATQPIRRGH